MNQEFEKEMRRFGYTRQPITLSISEAEVRIAELIENFKKDFISPAEFREYEALRRAMIGYKNPTNAITENIY